MGTKIVFLKEKKFSNPVAFTGLPGVGLVGKIVVDYLLKELKMEKIAEIFSDSFPPSVHTKKGIIELIKDEIYLYNFNGRDYLFLAGPIQPSLDLRLSAMPEHYEFAEKIIEALEKVGVKEVCTLAGINVGEKRMLDAPKVVAAATDQRLLDEWIKLGAVSSKGEGFISGAAGLLLGISATKGIVGSCLMGETNARLVYGDPGAAKKVLELLIKRHGFKVDMSRIEKEAKNIEKAFKDLSKQLSEEEDKPADLTYVR